VLYWQAPSILNPYLSSGTKDVETASLVLEGLAGFDEKGVVFARLAESVPTVENGGITADLMQITWKLKPGLLWSDGTPVTSADAKFTYEYCTHPEGGCAQAARYEGIASDRDARRPDHRHQVHRAEAEPLHRLRRRHLADPAEGAVRQLPGRGGLDLHRPELQPDRHRPLRGHRLQGTNDVVSLPPTRTTATRPSPPSPP
jgi:hypothetical protein